MTHENIFMGLREYARHREVASTSVSDAIKAGRISDAVVGTGKKRKIIWKYADELWLRNTTINNKNSDKITQDDKDAADITKTYNASRAAKEGISAQVQKLKYQKMAGELVEKKEVEAAASDMARILRDQLLNIPDKLAPILAAETDIDVVHQIIEDEIHSCLESLSNGGLDGLS